MKFEDEVLAELSLDEFRFAGDICDAIEVSRAIRNWQPGWWSRWISMPLLGSEYEDVCRPAIGQVFACLDRLEEQGLVVCADMPHPRSSMPDGCWCAWKLTGRGKRAPASRSHLRLRPA